MSRFKPIIKSVVYPTLLVLAHNLTENWSAIVHLLGPHFAWLGGPMIVGVGGFILHQLESPTKGGGQQ